VSGSRAQASVRRGSSETATAGGESGGACAHSRAGVCRQALRAGASAPPDAPRSPARVSE
jgi:hypothetical protein